jgi:predicted ATPase
MWHNGSTEYSRGLMSSRDAFHEAVKQALTEDGWSNIAPLSLKYGQTKLEIDLGAEQLLMAQKGMTQIAVEVKSFASSSIVYEFHQALGQYLHYRMALNGFSRNEFHILPLPLRFTSGFLAANFFKIV